MVKRYEKVWVALMCVLSFMTMGVRACEPVEDIAEATCQGECRCALDNCLCESGACSFECDGACFTSCAVGAFDCAQAVAAEGGVITRCEGLQTCDLSAGDGSDVDCEGSAECSMELGANADVRCAEQSNCDVTVGANSSVVCTGVGTCSADVGDDSTVRCGAQGCTVVCQGDCTISGCQSENGCDVTCAGGGEPTACLGNDLQCGQGDCL